MQLSEHFHSSEFACRCGCGDWHAHPLLVATLEELRWLLGGKPISITSGLRCAAHNVAVGGAPASKHLDGRAADIAVKGMTGLALYELAKDLPAFRGLGIGARFLHVDVRHGPPSRWRYDSRGRAVAL